ncbi:hypothetical protein SBP02_11955 [Pseudomonas benzenivorans]|uniref:Uncharacterized protein n=1 Tax=Pseudomonas benzenivorans TaxID=556533 RepID=A0ABZ0PRF5_9PSED|nr:hypothetical protein [Pseudomonas benzenivorans]WPC03499.1 hypothetical protein SBP02_11955 [Pseudomonas benzenivorans]
MNIRDPETKMAIAEEYMREFNISKMDLVEQNIEPGRFIIDTYDGLDIAIMRSRKLTKFMIDGLAKLYIQDPSKAHLRMYAELQLESDLGM